MYMYVIIVLTKSTASFGLSCFLCINISRGNVDNILCGFAQVIDFLFEFVCGINSRCVSTRCVSKVTGLMS